MSVLQPMSHATANWHWKNKNIGSWARQWFERELAAIKITGDGEESIQIADVTEVDGDVELGQRKSKLITIYDVKIELNWSGKASDGTQVDGKLVIPEVSHEITLDGISEYMYNWTLSTKSSKPVDALFRLVKEKLPVALETKFAEFPAAIIETHGKDLTVSAEPSRTGTPVQPTNTTSTTTAAAPAPKSAAKSPPPKTKLVNTSTVEVEATFMAAADELFSLFTDENRIPIWSRAPAQSTPAPGSGYSLFGGGVRGKYVSLDAPKQIIQTWSLQSPNWPSGHEATLTTSLDQPSESTTVKFTLNGVPLGKEDEIKRNLEGYYIQGLKSIGYVQLILSTHTTRSSSSGGAPRIIEVDPARTSRQYLALTFAALAFIAAFCIPFLHK